MDLALVDGRDGMLDLRVGGGQDPHDMRIALARIAQQLIAVLARHPLVGDQDRKAVRVRIQQRLALFDRASGHDRRQGSDGTLEILDGRRLVIDEQNRR